MKKIVTLMLLALLVFGLASCTTYDKKLLLTGTAKMSTEPQSMWARPNEVTYEIMGDVEGTAEYKMLFGFIPLGDAPKTSFAIFGNTTNTTPGTDLAAYDACKTIGADGIYLTSIYTETKNGVFVDSELVTITGKALKLVDLGTVDQERADTVRYLEASRTLDKRNLAPNISGGSAFGGLGNIFSFLK